MLTNKDTTGYIIVYVTAPIEKATSIAKHLLEMRLAACINMLEVESLYWWQGKIEKDKEKLLIIKTKKTCFEKLVDEIKKIHPYEVPEIIAVPIERGNTDYLTWIDRETVC